MHFTEQNVMRWARKYYRINGQAQQLSGYDEQNFLLETATNERYIFKIASNDHNPFFLDAQVKILQHLSNTALADRLPSYIPSYWLVGDGEAIVPISVGNAICFLRVLTFLEGQFWVKFTDHSPALLQDLGAFLGTMDAHLANFSHPAMHRYCEWDIAHAVDVLKYVKHIRRHDLRRLVDYFLLQFDAHVVPLQSELRMAYVHNDANDYNILVKDDRIAGLIDFGDMVHTHLINNLAIACTYALFGKDEPLTAAAHIVGAYHRTYPLTALELSVLYYCIAARLCISLAQSAKQAALGSVNEHHFLTEKSATELLFRWVEINPVLAEATFRKACGFDDLRPSEDYSALKQRRYQHVGRNLSLSYRKNLKIVKGALQYLYDDQGRTYVDCVNNVSHVGHCHPAVVRAMQKQIATLNTNTRYLNDAMMAYAEALTTSLPAHLKVCYFTNSGSEANDLAVRMSRFFTRQKEIIVLDHAYHGTSTVALEMSPYKFDGKGGFEKPSYIHKAMNPDLYRGKYRANDAEAGKKYAADVQRIADELAREGRQPAAFICETLLGVGGQIPLPKGYLAEVYRIVRQAGGLCIADEVQVGFGRVGDAFWGFELQNVEPDIVVLGKPIGNGHPVAAVVVSEQLADAFNNGMEYFNTFGGNPVSMVTAQAVWDTIHHEQMQAHARETGNYLMELLRKLMAKHPIIGDVRGHGLFIGAELVRDRETLTPAVPEIDEVVEQMKDRGFLLSTDGPLHNVLKIKPPLVFSKENAENMCRHLDEVLGRLAMN
jgi:4-aminobutyrate aminotransferase-like enzyme/Ser/Thr protein kinase RdoA (MazF antagonist)